MWWFFSLSIIPVVLLTGYFTWSQSQLLINHAHQQLKNERDRYYVTITSYFDDQVRAVSDLAASDLAISSGGRFYGFPNAFQQLGDDNIQAQRQLTQLRQQALHQTTDANSKKYQRLYRRFNHQYQSWLARHTFRNVAMFDLSENLVYAAKFDALTDNSPALKNAVSHLLALPDSQRPPWIRTPFSARGSQTMQAWYLAPVIKSGQIQSILAISTTTSSLSATLRQRQRPDTGLWLVNRSHQSLLSSWVPHTNQATLSVSPPKDAIHHALNGKKGVLSPGQHALIPQLTAYRAVNIAKTPWALITCQPQKTAYQPLYRLYTTSVTLVIALFILCLLVGHWLSQRLALPILQLTWCAEQFAAGELDYPVTHRQRQDEIGRLATALSHLQQRLKATCFSTSSPSPSEHTPVMHSDSLHHSLVIAMNLALDAWDGDKVGLAEQSGLWRVYSDKGSLQTRTLDKYLHLETVPKTPRWRNVVRSLDFVIQHTEKLSPYYQPLKQAQQEIQYWITQDKGQR
ncbi:HAMP domain-containing protein [Salinivibrio sp. ES.052]|uniref:HAMP domain-containing protein n=1 Tax=Salinivibrio sp. ES.052 TaxID=1882823 RepID=UPI0015881230|nr:HAMP domain-containing protein [Salinivibrio sp. ES.052]